MTLLDLPSDTANTADTADTADTAPAAGRAPVASSALAKAGVHRDPGAGDSLGTATFSQRLVQRLSGLLAGKGSTRRSFLTRTAIVGSALAMGPVEFALKPGTAYGYVCGTCGDGWTAFCCTINNGSNSCPPNSFVAGWWKADNAAYCCGSARYIIDCNATCPTRCQCRCAGGACDGRRTCCNQFRYGQCHQEISCYGPVVCRVATCTPPWLYDPSCTTSSATDNRTRDHGAPCISTDCSGQAIERKYADLGGAAGFLGAVTDPTHPVGDGRGMVATYERGAIYWSPTTGAFEVHGAILDELNRQGSVGRYGYPITDTTGGPTDPARVTTFEHGRIFYVRTKGTYSVLPENWSTYSAYERFLGVPLGQVGPAGLRGASVQLFERGRLYGVDGRVNEVHGAVVDHHEALGGIKGQLGFPINNLTPIDDGRGKAQWFEGGICWYSPTTLAHSVWGPVLDRYAANAHCKGPLGYPTSSPAPVGDNRGVFATFEHGRIYATVASGSHAVPDTLADAWLNRFGGPRGSYGYPTAEATTDSSGAVTQAFEGGRLTRGADGAVRPA